MVEIAVEMMSTLAIAMTALAMRTHVKVPMNVYCFRENLKIGVFRKLHGQDEGFGGQKMFQGHVPFQFMPIVDLFMAKST